MRAAGLLVPIVLALALSVPARAESPGRDQPFVLALIFDHCLAYARDGATPFLGIAAPAPLDPALSALAADFPASAQTLRLTGWDYLAFWGSQNGRRFCAVVEAGQAPPDGLRVGPDLFDQITAQAAASGLVPDLQHAAYDRRDGRWRAADQMDDPFRGPVISVSVGPLGSATEHLQALGASAPELLAH